MGAASDTAPMRESALEAILRKRCRAAGVLCHKHSSPATSGVPDRVLIGRNATTGAGRVIFVELKRPEGRTSVLQDARIAELRAHGAEVAIVDSRADIDELLHRVYGIDERAARDCAAVATPTTGPVASAATFAPTPDDPLTDRAHR